MNKIAFYAPLQLYLRIYPTCVYHKNDSIFWSQKKVTYNYSCTYLLFGSVVFRVWDVLWLAAVVAGLCIGAGLLAGGLVPGPGPVRVADHLLQAHDLVAIVTRVDCTVVKVSGINNT